MVKIRLPQKAVFETTHLLGTVGRFLDEVEPALERAPDAEAAEFEKIIARDATPDDMGQWLSELDNIRGDYDKNLLPTLAQTCITLIYSAIETQLPAVLLVIAQQRGIQLKPRELHGSAVDSGRLFLRKVLKINLTEGPGWQALRDLEDLRTVIVHKNARLSPDDKLLQKLRSVAERYPEGLDIDDFLAPIEVRVSVGLARNLLADVREFFSDLCLAGDLITEVQFGDEAT